MCVCVLVKVFIRSVQYNSVQFIIHEYFIHKNYILSFVNLFFFSFSFFYFCFCFCLLWLHHYIRMNYNRIAHLHLFGKRKSYDNTSYPVNIALKITYTTLSLTLYLRNMNICCVCGQSFFQLATTKLIV